MVVRVETEAREEGHKESLGVESVSVAKVGAKIVFKDPLDEGISMSMMGGVSGAVITVRCGGSA